MKGDSDSGAAAPSQTAEAAPAPGSLGETNALLRELVNGVQGMTAELRRLQPAQAALTLSPNQAVRLLATHAVLTAVPFATFSGTVDERVKTYADIIQEFLHENSSDVPPSLA